MVMLIEYFSQTVETNEWWAIHSAANVHVALLIAHYWQIALHI